MSILNRVVTQLSDGSDADRKVFDSMVEKAQIDVNSEYAKNVMFTTPKTYTPPRTEGFNGKRFQDLGLGITTIAGLLIIVYVSHRFLLTKTR